MLYELMLDFVIEQLEGKDSDTSQLVGATSTTVNHARGESIIKNNFVCIKMESQFDILLLLIEDTLSRETLNKTLHE